MSEEDMAGASKELDPSKPSPHVGSYGSVGSWIYSLAKKIIVVGTVYFVGYMGWSVAWLIAPLFLSVARDEWRKESDMRRNIAKASALASEKDVILARLDDLPAWVFFPDIERAEWLNRILRQVWPNVNHYARGLIKDSIEPSVAAALAKYKLHGFKFDRLILGTIPPRIGGVKVYDRNVDRNEVIMDMDIFYAGNCDITFVLGGIKGGIRDFQIHGMVRVVLKPLISKIPLFGGIQVFFLNNPSIDFNLVGVADLLDMPGLSDLLRRIIVEQVAAMMVLPNKMAIQMSDEIPAQTLKMPEPEGVLRIHVVEAKHLMKKDIGVLGKGKSDPYAIVTVGAQEFRTQTIDNTVDPKWDYWCEMAIEDGNSSLLAILLYDKDRTADESLGRATVEVNSVAKKGQIDTWLTLEQAKHGMVHLRMTWLTLTSNPNDLQAALEETQLLRVTSMSTALLTIFIDSAKNLPQARVQSKPDPYVVASVGKNSEQTQVQMRTDCPVWEQGYTFLVANPDNDGVYLKIVDHKTGNEIGKFAYALSGLLELPNMQIENEPFTLQKSGPESKIILSMSLRILKYDGPVASSDVSESGDGDAVEQGNLSRSSSVRSSHKKSDSSSDKAPPSPAHSIRKQDSIRSNKAPIALDEELEPLVEKTEAPTYVESIPGSPKLSGLVHRTPSVTSTSGAHDLGRIQLTLRYSVQRQRLVVIVHKIMHIPLKDPSNIPDPYVKLYLLPSRSKDSKRKTAVIKDNCNPVFDESFEYIISQGELSTTQLEVTVATQKGFLSGGSPVIGQVILDLNDYDLSQASTHWLDLCPEFKS
ncbi:extended synaptotagmin-2 isoform X2 [Ctenocephalides felis]|uniref:extended synaptotagmin-2 isoform X2 n=2 Tax=Ctenocephalides felis TaxID=7515 RepID=UPI000E6E3C12|nr:extended synaptotagmin-2 isoform X2 [Ctenocephalides felis]